MHTLPIAFATMLAFAIPAFGQAHQPYAGHQDRSISSLSEQDVAELEKGAGWGLALPAELNGYPGPAHVLELSEALELSDAQHDTIGGIVAEMRTDAIAVGAALIAAEAALDQAFRSGEIDVGILAQRVADAEAARAKLRTIHLSRHLVTRSLLSDAQIDRYITLRGYQNDPCAVVPDGHDPAMWRRHNGCSD